MSTAAMTTADLHLRDSVVFQLEWDPAVEASGIGVSAKDATIALSGHTDTYSSKLAAERAAKQVHGVRAVANDIEVTQSGGRSDTDIAEDVAHALRMNTRVPATVQASIRHGQVSLTGRAEWQFQKLAAEQAVSHIRGVRHVLDYIEVAPKALERDVHKRIVRALHENATLDARGVEVTLDGDRITLTGTTGSLLQREAAEWAAAQAPGVVEVDNRISVVNRFLPV